MVSFLSDLGERPRIRISHVDVVQAPLKRANLKDYDKRRIIGFMENHQLKDLLNYLIKINIDKNIGNILLDVAHLKICRLDSAIKLLSKYPDLYSNVVEDLIKLNSTLDNNSLSKCWFDGGIYRSLDFYSGIVFQCDLNSMLECVGGGEFTGLVESFGARQTVNSIGMAAGVKRLMDII